jgi:hypothetical protein
MNLPMSSAPRDRAERRWGVVALMPSRLAAVGAWGLRPRLSVAARRRQVRLGARRRHRLAEQGIGAGVYVSGVGMGTGLMDDGATATGGPGSGVRRDMRV